MEIWELKPPGTLWSTPGLLRDSFTFTFGNSEKDGRFMQHDPASIPADLFLISQCAIFTAAAFLIECTKVKQ
jgi:hypothetical protein